MAQENKRKQRTPKGKEIGIPTKREFLDVVERVTGGRVGRKRPVEKDQPPEQSR